MKKELIKCPLCASSSYEIVYPALPAHRESRYAPAQSTRETGMIVRCGICDVVYKAPFPKQETLKAGYEESIDNQYVTLLPERRASFLGVIKNIERRVKRGRLLDIGCGEGTLLDIARQRGWDVTGVEPNKHFVAWAEKNYHLSILQGDAHHLRLCKNYYDVITLLDVIEHVHNPDLYLKRCYQLLAPGGVIFISTPNFDSIISRVMRRRWFYILSIHVFYFTTKTLSALLRKSGFVSVKVHKYMLKTSLGYVLEKSHNYIGTVGVALDKLARATKAHRWPIKYWLGQSMFIAEKPNIVQKISKEADG